MKKRCLSPRNKDFKNYGARGITVCERWLKFENFVADMGQRPHPKALLDRIDNSKGYELGNCRWATPRQSGGNTRKNVFLTFRGETHHAAEWARRTGIGVWRIYYGTARGWNVERIMGQQGVSPS